MSLFDHCQDIEVLLQAEEAAAFLCSLKPNKITSPNPQMNEMTFTTNTPKRQRRWCIDIGFPILNVRTILRVIENVVAACSTLGCKSVGTSQSCIFTLIGVATLLDSSVWFIVALCIFVKAVMRNFCLYGIFILDFHKMPKSIYLFVKITNID